MISAFGVEHFSKSQLPNGTYKAATKLTPKNRVKIKNTLAENKEVRNNPDYQKLFGPKVTNESIARFRQRDGMNMKLVYGNEKKIPRGQLKVIDAKKRSETGLAGYAQPDGKGGGKVKLFPNDEFSREYTLKHEMAHIAPKRNPVSWSKRVKKPRRLGREEGRADFIARGRPTPGEYPGSNKFQRGYDEVQTKMARAKGQS